MKSVQDTTLSDKTRVENQTDETIDNEDDRSICLDTTTDVLPIINRIQRHQEYFDTI